MSQAIQSIWVHITSGRGPDECALAVKKLFEHLSKDAHAHHLVIEIIDSTAGETSAGKQRAKSVGHTFRSRTRKPGKNICGQSLQRTMTKSK